MPDFPKPSLSERARFLYFHTLMILSYLTDRIEVIIRKDRLEAPELLSVACCFCFTVPMLLNSEYLSASVYMSALAQYIGQGTLTWIYAVLGIFQGALVLFGGEPSPFIKNELSKRRWLIWRMSFLLIASFVWAVTAGLISFHSVTFGTLFFGGMVVWCILWCWRLAFVYKVFSGVARELPETDTMLFDIPRAVSILP